MVWGEGKNSEKFINFAHLAMHVHVSEDILTVSR
jgi:hypothetical protein